jgi:hypothetical protein
VEDPALDEVGTRRRSRCRGGRRRLLGRGTLRRRCKKRHASGECEKGCPHVEGRSVQGPDPCGNVRAECFLRLLASAK